MFIHRILFIVSTTSLFIVSTNARIGASPSQVFTASQQALRVKLDLKKSEIKDKALKKGERGFESLISRVSTGLAQVTSNPYAQMAIMLATTLTTAVLVAIPVIGAVLAGVFGTITALFGHFFGVGETPTSDDIFNDVQGRITSIVRSVTNDVLNSEQELANQNAIQLIQENMNLYQQASSGGMQNFEAKISALENLAESFRTFRASPDIFVSASFLNTTAPFYLMQKAGTKLCFGPRRSANGDPECM
jgi:hypothetical protein